MGERKKVVNSEYETAVANEGKRPAHLLHGLLKRIKEGDEKAFGDFYIGYVDSIVRFLMRLLGSEEDAKEITQEIFVVLWEKRERIDPEKALENLLYTAAKHKAYKVLRRKTIHAKYNSEKIFTADELDYSAEDLMIGNELSAKFEEILASLPPQQRRVFVASRVEGKQLREIAREMGITYETARTHMKLASKAVKDCMIAIIPLLFLHVPL